MVGIQPRVTDVRLRVMAVAIRRPAAMVADLRTAAAGDPTVEDRTAVDMGGNAALEFFAPA
jgi:hypothetical protein